MITHGYLAVLDKGTVYAFYQDGVFASFPFGASGRTYFGTWTGKMDGKGSVTAIAREGWINGLSSNSEDFKIVFCISSGHTEPIPKDSLWRIHEGSFGLAGDKPRQIEKFFKGHFIIEEIVNITSLKVISN